MDDHEWRRRSAHDKLDWLRGQRGLSLLGTVVAGMPRLRPLVEPDRRHQGVVPLLRHTAPMPGERCTNTIIGTGAAPRLSTAPGLVSGEQRVTVQHVTVNEGGQAVVGNVSHRGGGGRRKNREPTS